MRLIDRVRPIHVVVLAGYIAVIAVIAGITKAVLASNFVPATTYDANGVAVINGPFSYDNALLDNIFIYGIYIAFVLVVGAGIMRHRRPLL